MTQEQVANYVVLTIVVGALAIGLLSMLVGRLVAFFDWVGSWWGQGVEKALHYRPVPMSSYATDEDDDHDVVSPVVTTYTTAKQPIVTPNNEYSSVLFDTTAKSIAAMYQKGVITNLSKAICAAYGCTVQSASKPDSTYQIALKAVNKYLPAKDAPQFRMTPEMENAREALGLNQH